MSVEQRLVAALRTADRLDPSADLWARVVHSIEEDRAHRRRVRTSTLAVAATAAGLLLVGLAGLTDGPLGRHVRLPLMEAIETVALVVLIGVLGPAIRRFGRGYARDLWRATPATAEALLRLLDIAYLLVFAGYLFLTVDFDADRQVVAAVQLEELGGRIGGLLMTMGLLHALTIMVLPVVALVSNSTRVGRALPRWLVIALVLAAIALGPPVVMTVVTGLVGLAGS